MLLTVAVTPVPTVFAVVGLMAREPAVTLIAVPLAKFNGAVLVLLPVVLVIVWSCACELNTLLPPIV